MKREEEEEEEEYDIIVIGGGIMGSSIAYSLIKKQPKLKILLIEQFDLGHLRGASHGLSRIIRKTYTENFYTKLMIRTFKLWEELFIEEFEKFGCSSGIYRKTGGIDIGSKYNQNLNKIIQNCQNFNIKYQLLNSDEIKEKFPVFKVGKEDIGIFQENSGILNASKAVKLFQDLFRLRGGIIFENESVNIFEVLRNNGGILVTTQSSSHSNLDISDQNNKSPPKNQIKKRKAKKIILACGSWTADIINKSLGIKLDLHTIKITYGYYPFTINKVWESNNSPLFIHYDEPHCYGFPSSDFPGLVKIAPHFSSEVVEDPNQRNFIVSKELLQEVKNFIEKNLNYLNTDPQRIESCLYTKTPDSNFVLDFLPNTNKSVLIAAGFSGHGFKMAPIIGEIICDLTLEGVYQYSDLCPFSLINPQRNLILKSNISKL